MRISVDFDRCESNGLCAYAAPEVFRIDDDGNLDYDAAPAASQADAVRDAVAGCPTGAIRIDQD